MADRKTLELQIQLIADRASAQLKTFATDVKNAAENAKNFTGNSKSVASSIKAMQEEAKRTAASIKLFGGNTNELRNATARMKATILDLIQGGLKPESQEVQNLVNQYKNLESQLDSTERQQNGFLGMLGEIKNEIEGVAVAAAALAVDKALVGFAAGALEVNNSFQAARDNFGIMLNDMEAGRGLFNELQEFNFWTPFDIETTAQATAVLRTAKVELGDITKYLTRFGDLSRGNAQTMQSFTNAFSKASAKGKADMEVLNVFIDQGVQILDQLAKQMGTTSAQIVKMASEGKISFADLDQAIAELTAEGGQYYNTMATAAMRLDAVQAGLEESTKSLHASFGEMLAPVVAKVLGIFTDIVDAINNSPILKGILAAAVTALTVAINTLAIKAIGSLIAKLWSAYAAQMGLNSAMSIANPALLVLIGTVAVATAGYVAYAASQQEAADATAALALEQQKLDEQLSSKKWMSNLSLDDLQKALANYRNTIIPDAENLKKEIEEKLESIPEKILVKDTKRTRGVQRIIKKDNPEYKEALVAIDELTKKLREYDIIANAIEEEITDRIAKHASAIAAFGTEWQDKLAGETPNILAEQERALTKLNKKAEEAFGKNYKVEQTYLKEVEALNKYYEKKRADELKKRLENEQKALAEVNKWLFNGNNAKQLEAEKLKEIQKLQNYTDDLKKKGYITEVDQRTALFNLELDYEKRIHAAKLADLKNYAELNAERLANAAKNTAMDNAGEAGQIAKGFSQGGVMGGLLAALQALVAAVLNAIASLENGKKALNFITTIVERIFKIIGDFVNDALEPAIKFFEAFGDAIGRIIRPLAVLAMIIAEIEPIIKIAANLLESLGHAFDWFYNGIFVPIANQLIKWLNKIPGINIKLLQKTTEAEDLAEKIEKQQELLTKKYQRLISSVDDLLNSQLEALRSQYELGLISRDDYESQAEKYAVAADEKRYELEKKMNENLEAIKNNTYAALSEEEKNTVDQQLFGNGFVQKALDTGEYLDISGTTQAIKKSLEDGNTGLAAAELVAGPAFGSAIDNFANGNIAEGVADVLTGGMYSGIKSVGKKIGNVFKKLKFWDVGTPEIPYDHIAMVHKGETIIPKTFAEGIRSGELALVGKNDRSHSSSGSPIVIQMKIEGSVVTENQIVDAVYNGIAKGIQQRKYTPLPGATA